MSCLLFANCISMFISSYTNLVITLWTNNILILFTQSSLSPTVPNHSSITANFSPSNASGGCGRSNANGPTPDTYFRSAAAMNGLHPYSYAAEAAAAACAWVNRLDHSSSSLSARLDSTSTSGFHPSLASNSTAFRRTSNGKW